MGNEPAVEGQEEDDSQDQNRHDNDGGVSGRPGQVAFMVTVGLYQRHRSEYGGQYRQVREVDKG